MTNECKEWLDQQAKEFVVPVVEYDQWVSFDDAHGETHFVPWDVFQWEEVPKGESGQTVTLTQGFCARLSAPGYLDCTEWIGPYATEDEAFEALFEMFGDDC